RFARRNRLYLVGFADDPVEQRDLHRELLSGGWQRPRRAGDLSRQPVALRQSRIETGSHTDQPARRHRVDRPAAGFARADTRGDRLPFGLATTFDLAARPEFDLLVRGEFAGDETPTEDAAAQVGGVRSRSVDVETPGDVEAGVRIRIAFGRRDLFLYRLHQHIEIGLLARTHRHHRSVFGHRPRDELLYLLVVPACAVAVDEV